MIPSTGGGAKVLVRRWRRGVGRAIRSRQLSGRIVYAASNKRIRLLFLDRADHVVGCGREGIDPGTSDANRTAIIVLENDWLGHESDASTLNRILAEDFVHPCRKESS
jgi:hypothetical protein